MESLAVRLEDLRKRLVKQREDYLLQLHEVEEELIALGIIVNQMKMAVFNSENELQARIIELKSSRGGSS